MAGIVRHRQTKGPATDRSLLNHRATPRLHNAVIVELNIRSGNEAPHQTDESAREVWRSFIKSHLGINANVQTEPPVGILLAA
jgi:hypothetical protein